jgi:hypothetical protein
VCTKIYLAQLSHQHWDRCAQDSLHSAISLEKLLLIWGRNAG